MLHMGVGCKRIPNLDVPNRNPIERFFPHVTEGPIGIVHGGLEKWQWKIGALVSDDEFQGRIG